MQIAAFVRVRVLTVSVPIFSLGATALTTGSGVCGEDHSTKERSRDDRNDSGTNLSFSFHNKTLFFPYSIKGFSGTAHINKESE